MENQVLLHTATRFCELKQLSQKKQENRGSPFNEKETVLAGRK